MIINHNLAAANARRLGSINDSNVDKSIGRLSSGLRINTAADDASGLAVSEKMRAQVSGLNQASRNIQDGGSLIQTAAGYLSNTTDILQRMRELAVQSANGIYSADDRQQIQVEVNQLVDETDRLAKTAQFNGLDLLTGQLSASGNGPLTIQAGANMDQSVKMGIGDMRSVALGIRGQGDNKALQMDTVDNSNRAIGILDNALKIVTKQRADLGAFQNRLNIAKKGVDLASQNMQASESRIRDLDMSKQVVQLTKQQVLSQASNAMLAQANTRPQQVLALLR